MQEVNVNVTGEKGIVEVRTGQALPLKEPVAIGIIGTINTVSTFLINRISTIEALCAKIDIDRDDKSILLTIDEQNAYSGKIKGKLTLSKLFENWNINTGHEYEAKKLADFIKMNRSAFESNVVAMKLVSELSNLVVKVNREYEKADDNRANTRISIAQKVVDMNIPEKFNLNLPIFKGEKKVKIEVEIYVDADTYKVQLVSPDAAEFIMTETDRLIDNEIVLIKDAMKNEIVIIES